MLMLSSEGWIIGLVTMGCIIFGVVLGILLLYNSMRIKAKLLSLAGLLIIFMSLIYIGVTLDFFTIIITGNNINDTLQSILSFVWVAPLIIVGTYIGAEIIVGQKKWYIISFFLIAGFFYELILFLDLRGSLFSSIPSITGEELIHTYLIFGTPLFIFQMVVTLSANAFVVLGLIFKGVKSEGIIKKKFFLLSIGFIVFGVFAMIDSLAPPTLGTIALRVGAFSSFIFWYLALKEKTITPDKMVLKKEVSLEESLFRLSELKPGKITMEEVTFYRERKICLVCKGKVVKFNYICECDALYCENCVKTLSSLENACWACNTPFDESKPSKPYNIDKKEGEIKMAEKIPKEIDL